MRLYKVRETVRDSGVLGSDDSGRPWCGLSTIDFNAACLVSPFVESTGRLAVELDGRFGGWSECIAAGPFDLRERFAAALSPVHRRYRWYPPRGSTLLDGRSLASAFLAGINGVGREGQDAAELSTECGFTDNVIQNQGVRRHLTLELPDGRRYLIFVGVPHRSDGRDERIPWLHNVTDRDFANVEQRHRSQVAKCWDSAWSWTSARPTMPTIATTPTSAHAARAPAPKDTDRKPPWDVTSPRARPHTGGSISSRRAGAPPKRRSPS